MKFDHRSAVVTGAGGNIGRQICLGFAREGVAVAVTDFNLKSAEATAQAVRDAGGRAEAFELDVTSTEAVQAVAKKVFKAFGKIGYWRPAKFVLKP